MQSHYRALHYIMHRAVKNKRRGSPPGNREASPGDPLPAAAKVSPKTLKSTEMTTTNPNTKP